MSCASPPRCRCTAFESCSRRRTRRDRTTCSRRRAISPRAAAAVDGIEFAALVQMWDVLKIDKELQGRRAPGYNCDFILALARSRCDAQTAARLDSRLAQAARAGAAHLRQKPRRRASTAAAPAGRDTLAAPRALPARAPPPARPSPPPCRGRPNSWPSWTTAAAAFSEQLHAEWYEGGSLKAPYAQKRGK